MTYLQFHLLFILPPIALLAFCVRTSTWPRVIAGRASGSLFVITGIAFLYTTPWDNYLVYHRIWYYGPDRVLGTIGYVPVEEYAFFLLQPILTGLWLYALLPFHLKPRPSRARPARVLGTLFWLGLAAAGYLAFQTPKGTYLGLILTWSCPVIAGMWAWKGPVFWELRRLLVFSIAPPTLYLWIADRVAIGLGIWTIAPETSTGLLLLGLPVEEAVFFLVTNTLCVLGLILLLNGWKAYPCPARQAAPDPRPKPWSA